MILTLQLDASTFESLTALRKKYFPPERYFVDAHITLFHALPDEHQARIIQTLGDECARTPKIILEMPRLRSLGRGVAIEVEGEDLLKLRENLRQAWTEWLSPQDRQKYRPHVTIQNKVSAAQAAETYQLLSESWELKEATAQGLTLWRYLGGPWEKISDFTFR